jgi:SAM-dependent methyltransferase
MMNKQPIIQHFDALALHRAEWYSKNRLYHEQIIKLCRLFMNPDSRVLELGCSTGDTLAALNPSYGVGIDISPCMIAEAQKRYPNLYWICADAEALPQDEALSEPFDLIIMEDLAGYLSDIQQFFADIRPLTHSRTRLIISTWNWIWEPVLILGEYLKLKAPEHEMMENWVSASVLSGLLRLTGYDPLQIQPGLLFPYHVPVLSSMINTLSFSPLFGRLTLSSIIVARPLESPAYSLSSVSVIIPVRNEVGNIAAIVERTPDMGAHTELIFVDGNSTDGTVPEIRKQIDLHPERDIRLIPQVPMHDSHVNTPPNLMLKLGKGDATRKGFDAASGEILMILDGDVSVPPEDSECVKDLQQLQ